MAIETVDGLELVISAKSQDAADSIRNLSASVTSFGKEIGKYVHGLQTFAEAIRTISDAAKGLSGIKNIRSIASSVTGAVARAKTNVAGKQFTPAIPPVRGSYTVTGSNRVVNWKGQGIRRFDKTADEVAREMNRGLGGTRYNNKELSAQIQAIRQNAITGKDVMDEIEALARDLTGTAGSRNKSGLVSMLNSKFGKQYIGVTEKDLKGTGMTISAMNELARSQGGTFGFHMNGDSAKIRGLDEVEESLLKAFGVETAHVEDLIKALETNANVYSGHREQLDAMMADDDSALFGRVFNNLLSGVIANQKVEETKPAEAAKQAAETGKAVREALLGRGVTQTSGKDFFSMFNDRMGIGRTALSASESAKTFEKMFAEADRAEQARQEILGRGITRTGAKDFFDQFNNRMGIGRTPMSAAESAKVFAREAAKQAAESRAATTSWTPEQEAQRVAESKKQWEETMSLIAARKTEREAADAEEYTRNLRWFVDNNKPEFLRSRRAEAEKRGNLEGFNSFYGTVPTRADEAAKAGMITPETAQAMKDAFAGVKAEASGVGDAVRMTASEFMNTNSQADILQMKLDGVGQKLEEALNSDKQDPAKIANLATQYDKLKQQIKEAGEEAEKSAPKISMAGVGKAIGKTIERSIFGQLARVARMRGLRAIVKGAANAFKEGVGNMYQWSKGLGGDFAAALDTAASKILLMKNSVAAALSPALQALVPLLSTVANWVRDVSNAVSQFFALLTGQDTWTMATETAEEWAEKTKKGATGAGKAMKDLLADWDELNIIQGQSGGGGGSGTGKKVADYANMFKEMSVFDEWTHQFDEIRNVVIAIGAGIAGWFAISSVQDFLGKLGIAGDSVVSSIGKIRKALAGGVMLAVGFELSRGAGASFARNGFSWGALVEEIVGAISAGIGGALLITSFGFSPVTGIVIGLGISILGSIIGFVMEREEVLYEEAQKWAKKNAFEFDVDAKLNIVKTTIQSVRESRDELNRQASELIGTLDAIQMGIDDTATLANLKAQLGDENSGIIKDINDIAANEKSLLRLRYTMVPAMDENGKDISAEEYARKAGEWDGVADWFAKKGAELGALLVENEKHEIEISNKDLADQLIKQINDALQAVTMAKIEAEASVELNTAISTGAVEKIPKVYEDYMKQIRESGTEMYDELLRGQTELTSFYRSTEGVESDKYKNAYAELQSMSAPEYRQQFIDDFVSGMSKGAMDRIKDFLLGKYGEVGKGIDKNRLAEMTPEQLQKQLDMWNYRINSGEFWSLMPSNIWDFLQNNGVSTTDLLSEDLKEYLAEIETLLAEEGGYEAPGAGPNTNGFLTGDTEFEMDTTTSGLAEDATVVNLGQTMQAIGQAATESYARQEGFLRGIMNGINQLGNRPIQVNIGASSGLGRIGGRSGRMLDNITNMDQ